jgi:hypothetical protein
MAKKASKSKPKAQYGWVYSPTATAADKIKVENDFRELIAELKSNLPPLQVPQQFGQVVDYTTKWRGNDFYIVQRYKYPEGSSVEGADAPFARLTFYGVDRFNVFVQRHTGQWMELPMYANNTTAQVIEAIKTDPWFLG